MADFINPYHYRDPEAEQQRWQQLFTEKQAQLTQAQQNPVDVADAILAAKQRYPWMDLATVGALIRSGGSNQVVADAARIDADSKGSH